MPSDEFASTVTVVEWQMAMESVGRGEESKEEAVVVEEGGTIGKCWTMGVEQMWVPWPGLMGLRYRG